MYLLKHISLFIIHHSIRERCALDILHTILRVPLTIKIVHFEAPLFLRLQLIESCLEISTVRAMRCKEFNKFEACRIVFDLVVELLIAD